MMILLRRCLSGSIGALRAERLCEASVCLEANDLYC